MKQTEQLIGEVILDNLPKDVLGALRVMASLTYPISDRRSFLTQLENLVKDPQKSPPSEQGDSLRLVRGMITALDFPISTPVSGLEKIFAHFSDPYWEDFGLDLDIPDPGDFVEHPPFDGCTALRSMFIGACADRACEFYQQLVRDNVPEPAAFFAGIAEGRRCMHSGGYGSSATGSSYSPALVDPSDLVFGWHRRRRRGR